MNIIEQIKAEIERLRNNMDDRDPLAPNQKAGYLFALADVLSFLSTLKSEKPIEQKGLEEEFNHYCFDFKDPDTGEDILRNQISFNVEDALNVARHFAQWGAEHLADARKTSTKDLEEAANKFAVFYDQGTCDGIAQDCFISGAKWQAEQLLKGSPMPEDTVLFNKGVAEGKRQMKNEAVEADVNIYRDLAAGKSWAEFVVEMPTNNLGDKARIIILLKEDSYE